MLNIFFIVPMFLFGVGFWIYTSKRKHLMNMLISLEYIVLSTFLLLMMVTYMMGLEMYLGLIYLIASVCEGSLGVGIMVGMVRSHGSDYVSSLNSLLC
uniref:NADH-ubiquinone oxidoreductase chain 4L n=1 Tax=Chthamalus antennatus TaxID=1198010 RepID=A0A0D4CG34_CHTAT|nr:NADH dehydrogenase subunit 4L [Chthamalus antennatus]AJT48122.1 NADH dehydrogenase subunit 4L [Chthamalus antennatus]